MACKDRGTSEEGMRGRQRKIGRGGRKKGSKREGEGVREGRELGREVGKIGGSKRERKNKVGGEE